MDHLVHVVGLVRICRHDFSHAFVNAVRVVTVVDPRGGLIMVGRKQINQLPDPLQARLFTLHPHIRHAGHFTVHRGAAQLIGGDVFAHDRPDHRGAGDKHLADPVNHEDEVGQGRRVDRNAGAAAHNGGDLRDHPGSLGVGEKY